MKDGKDISVGKTDNPGGKKPTNKKNAKNEAAF